MTGPRIAQLDLAAASAEQRAAHDAELALRGRMTNMKRTLLHSPVALRVYGEWFALRDALRPAVPDRAIWLFAHAICVASGSPVGTLFMRRALADAAGVPQVMPVDAAEAALVAFGTALGRNPQAVPDAAWAPILMHYPDSTVVDLVAFAGLMVATNLFTDAVRTPIDTELHPYFER